MSLKSVLCLLLTAGQVSGQSILSSAAQERVNIVMMGDSNQLFGGHGWDHGWGKALRNRFGLYGTGLHWLGENFGLGSGAGYYCNTSANAGAGIFNYVGWAGDPYDPSPMGLRPCGTLSLLTGTSLNSVGMTLHGNSPFYNAGDSLHGDIYLRTLSLGASIQPQFRLGTAPYTVYAQTPIINYTTSNFQRISLTYTPTSSLFPLDWRIGNFTVAPYQAYYARIINEQRMTGCAVSTMYGFGGQSARDLAATLAALPDGFFINYCDTLKEYGNKIVFRIYMGLNDRNEPLPSYKYGYRGNSPEAYYDNLLYIISTIDDAMNNGATAGDYEVVITLAHPISTPNDAILERYASLITNKLRHPKVRIINMPLLISYAEMVSNGYYTSATDSLHLSQAGYEELSRREINAILGE